MSRIYQAFENKKAFIGFVTGGDPDLETTEKLDVYKRQRLLRSWKKLRGVFTAELLGTWILQAIWIRALPSAWR